MGLPATRQSSRLDREVIGGSIEQPVSLGDRLLIRSGAPVLVELQPAGDAAGHALPVLHVTAVRLDTSE
ncbi:MAG: hypothetical protein M3O41_02305 [Pseudomonadota bacterium]|nr:hypothetical protein [Pseudomonadota bacterium]